MKRLFTVILTVLTICFSSQVFAARIATNDDILRLKADLVKGKIKIGITRLKYFQEEYGDASSISDSERSITYDYGGDVRIDFSKDQIWLEDLWGKDGFKKAVYTDDVKDLRYDLSGGALVGSNISYNYIRQNYGEPTESKLRDGDGKYSIHWYGDIKLIFENVYVVKKIRSSNLVAPDDALLSQ